MNRITTAIEDLSYCGGCEIALADLGESLLELMDGAIELTYAPLLMSATEPGQVDVMLITGAARNQEDIERLLRARKQARYLVAFGSCAALGGIPSLGNLSGMQALLDAAYREAPSLTDGGGPPTREVPGLVDEVQPIDAYVDVDFYLTGCPPPPAMIADFLRTLLRRIKVQPAEEGQGGAE
jgi:coenzyme F420-reducing hydrogenase gamma subunit